MDFLVAQFKEKIKNQTGKIRAHAAIGYALQSEKAEYEEVFKKADERMYAHKKEMKPSGENSSVLL